MIVGRGLAVFPTTAGRKVFHGNVLGLYRLKRFEPGIMMRGVSAGRLFRPPRGECDRRVDSIDQR